MRLAEKIAGTVQAISRSGTWALVIRRTGVLASGDNDRALIRVPLAGTTAETTPIPSGRVQYARLTSDELHAILAIDESTVPGTVTQAFRTLPAVGGAMTVVRGTGTQTVVADVHIPR